MGSQDIVGALVLLGYYISFAAIIGLLTRVIDLPKEYARKAYHVACSLSIIILLLLFETWYAAVLSISLLLLSAFLILKLSDRIPFASIAIDRGNGIPEIREHLLYLLVSLVVLLVAFWAVLPGHQYAAALGLLIWGFGDAAASMAGRRFGKRRLTLPIFDPDKSLVGTWAAIATSALTSLMVLQFMTDLSLPANLLASLLLGLIAGFVEAATRRGLDTLTLPLAAGFAAWPVVGAAAWLLGGSP